MTQTHPVPVEIRRKRGKISVHVDGGNGAFCAPREYFCQIGDCEIDGIMRHVYSALMRRNEGKKYVYVPEFHFGMFVPGRIKRGIEEHRPIFDNVYGKMRDDPGYFSIIDRELTAYRAMEKFLSNGRGL